MIIICSGDTSFTGDNAVYLNSLFIDEVAVTHKPTDQNTLASMLYPTSTHPASAGIMPPHMPTLLRQTEGYGLRSMAGAQPASGGIMRPQMPTLLAQAEGFGLRSMASSTVETLPWAYVIRRFNGFQSAIALTPIQRKDGSTKFGGLAACLNAAYRNNNSQTDNAFMIGSWAKDTCIRPPRDVDMYYVLPNEVYYRFEQYAAGTNKQSALLQEVKRKLSTSYPTSSIRGDGPIVLADFHGATVEVAPAFLLNAEEMSYYVCDTKNGGRYMTTKPFQEVVEIDNSDDRTNGNTRPLIRLLKCWQDSCNVPVKSYILELLAIKFLDTWKYNNGGVYYYDWMCRDFFAWMVSQANGAIIGSGYLEIIWLGDDWKTRAVAACGRATKACQFERENDMVAAGDEWQKIFGNYIPRNV